jgi:hypothetical protein
VALGSRRGVDLRVQAAHHREPRVDAGEAGGEVLGLAVGRVPRSDDDPDRRARRVADADRLRLGPAEEVHARAPRLGAAARLGREADPGQAESVAAGIVVAAGGQEPHARLGEPAHLAREPELRAQRQELVVEEVARDEHGVEPLAEREVDGRLEGLARGAAQPLARRRASPEARLEVEVREVQEAERAGHGASLLVAASPRLRSRQS